MRQVLFAIAIAAALGFSVTEARAQTGPPWRGAARDTTMQRRADTDTARMGKMRGMGMGADTARTGMMRHGAMHGGGMMQGGGMGMGMGGDMHAMMMMMVMNRLLALDLTGDQWTRVRDIHRQVQREIMPIHHRLMEQTQAVHEALFTGQDADTNRIADRLRPIADLQTQVMAAHARAFVRIRGVLTAEQRAKFTDPMWDPMMDMMGGEMMAPDGKATGTPDAQPPTTRPSRRRNR